MNSGFIGLRTVESGRRRQEPQTRYAFRHASRWSVEEVAYNLTLMLCQLLAKHGKRGEARATLAEIQLVSAKASTSAI